MEYLTKQWPKLNQLSEQNKRLYETRKEKCQEWALQQNLTIQRVSLHHRRQSRRQGYREENEDSEDDSYTDDSFSSQNSNEENEYNEQNANRNAKRYRFDKSMLNIMEHIIIVKVYSHQLDQSCNVKLHGQIPRPNMLIASANQFADKAATQARAIIDDVPPSFDSIYFPHFSSRWCFTVEGRVTNKGATKVLYWCIDDELCARLQHRCKQGMMCRMLEFIGIKADFIGNESLYRNVVKGTAPSWTRIMYQNPNLPDLI